jgi:hypothetical protein
MNCPSTLNIRHRPLALLFFQIQLHPHSDAGVIVASGFELWMVRLFRSGLGSGILTSVVMTAVSAALSVVAVVVLSMPLECFCVIEISASPSGLFLATYEVVSAMDEVKRKLDCSYLFQHSECSCDIGILSVSILTWFPRRHPLGEVLSTP